MEGWEAGLSLSPTWPSTQGMHAGGQKLGAENQVQGGVCHLPPANSRLPGKHLDLSEPIPPLVKWKITRATRFAELLYGSLWASLVALKAQAIQINSFKKKKKNHQVTPGPLHMQFQPPRSRFAPQCLPQQLPREGALRPLYLMKPPLTLAGLVTRTSFLPRTYREPKITLSTGLWTCFLNTRPTENRLHESWTLCFLSTVPHQQPAKSKSYKTVAPAFKNVLTCPGWELSAQPQ